MTNKKRILFFSESITLAHITRPWAMACSLSENEYEVFFAVSELPNFIPNNNHIYIVKLLTSVSSSEFSNHLEKGTLPYNQLLITHQVQEDFKLIDTLKPDIVVGDFRLSLSISARLKNIPYINITNMAWSPFALQKTIVPEVKLKKQVGLKLSQVFFTFFKSTIFRKMAKPFNVVCSQFNLPIKFNSILDVYADGDKVFLADIENIVKLSKVPENYVIGGPINYSISNTSFSEKNINLDDLFEQTKPIVVVSLGSSGPNDLIEQIVSNLNMLPVNTVVSTAGKKINLQERKNLKIVPYISISEIAKKADLIIGSGGSATAYPCLSEGVPLLAIPSNLDQFQFANSLVTKGVAKILRTDDLSKSDLFLKHVKELIFSNSYKKNAKNIQMEMQKYDSVLKFQETINNLLPKTENVKKSDIGQKNKSEKNILLTGSNGFIGSHFLNAFPNCRIFDRKIHNIENIESLKDLICDVDVVVHLGGVNSGTSYNPSIAELVDGNAFFTSQLLLAIKKYNKKCPQFIFLSSIHVYDKTDLLFSEKNKARPNTSYGSMKYTQELLINQASESGIVKSIIFRAGHIYGPKSKPFYNTAIATLIHKIINKNEVELYGNGLIEFDLTYIDDLIKYITLAINKNLENSSNILNLGSGKSYSISDIVKTIESIVGFEVQKKYIDSPISKNKMDLNNLHQTLGTFEPTDLQDGLTQQIQEALQIQKEHLSSESQISL